MIVSLASLLLQETKASILATALSLAAAIGLPVTSWQIGDPTRSLYLVEADKLTALESIVVGYIGSGFLDYATGDWLVILAKQVFNVDVPGATYATADCVLTNNGGGVFDIAPGDLTAKDTLTGQTYHNITGGTLPAIVGVTPGTLTLTFEADAPGSASSAGATEIDALVTTLLEVTISNPLAAVGLDAQDEQTTRQQCRDKLGALSPNGPADAYSYVARNNELTGTTNVTRVRVYPDSNTGDVLVYIAGASGGSSGPDVAAVTAAIAQWATPLCITPTVSAANNVPINVTYQVWVYNSVNQTSDQIKAAILVALEDLFETELIGGDIIPPATTGTFYLSDIQEAVKVYPQIFRAVISAPTSDTALGNGDVPVLGTVTGTVTFVANPTGV